MHVLRIRTNKSQEIIDITSQVEEAVKKSKVKEGLCCVYARHATCAIIVNENHDPSVCEDILDMLNKLIPEHAAYKHDKIDSNAHAHIKAAILGPGEVIPVKEGKLQLGKWQGIALAEFDGPREREVIVDIVP